MTKRGLFIVFEGIDGSGKGTQMMLLADYIKKIDKYQDILLTHEPWKSKEIKKRLEEEKDAFSSGLDIARLFVKDRADHSKQLIVPHIEDGIFVMCDRYSLSTIAYQSAQGISISQLIYMHQNKRILKPDVTFFIDVSSNIAEERLQKRGDKIEKFEKKDFREVLIKQYRDIIRKIQENIIHGEKIIVIDGSKDVSSVAECIKTEFEKIYHEW
ncbi:MAG: dTMP kinase [Nanoarchaeota archaeon]